MPRRFVILEHDHPFLHWDLLLEEHSSARTWRLLRKPCVGETIAAERIPDHRLMYLDYEGPVSGERGDVKRFLSGVYELVSAESGALIFKLQENSFAVCATLRRFSDGREFVSFT